MPTTPKSGPVSLTELLSVWQAVTDEGLASPLIDKGDGYGIEAYQQGHAQLVRVSEAIDRSLQAMFIYPWSGQSNGPAQSAAAATVTLTFARTKHVNLPLVLDAGPILVEEQTTDWGENGPITVLTERRYQLQTPLVFAPGETGPFDVEAIAERTGYGYNNPLPGTLTSVVQPGTGLSNNKATVSTQPAVDLLVAANKADTVVPEHVGQYVQLIAGANAGAVKRMTAYQGPDPYATPPSGGTIQLERTVALEGVLGGGTAIVGEQVVQAVSGARGLLQKAMSGTPARLVLIATNGVFDATHLITGVKSAMTFAPTGVLLQPAMVAETPTIAAPDGATWRVLDWVVDWGLTVTNAESPVGGKIDMLGALGAERKIYRAPGESEDHYRDRVGQISDVVCPNAILRRLNQLLSPAGIPYCFREAGTSLLPGFFYDGSDPADALAYDNDAVTFTGVQTGTFLEGELVEQISGGRVAQGRAQVVLGLPVPDAAPAIPQFPPTSSSTRLLGCVAGISGTFVTGVLIVGKSSGATYWPGSVNGGLRAQNRFKTYFDYEHFRGHFLIGLPTLPFGEFGFAYDVGLSNAYDSQVTTFYDGFPVDAATIAKGVLQAVESVRAGGVVVELYREDIGCI